MKLLALIFALMLPVTASAGAYEDLQEALARQNTVDAINLIKRGVDVNTVDRDGNSLLNAGDSPGSPGIL